MPCRSEAAVSPVRRGREERLFLTTFSFGHFANDWTAGSILLLTPAIAIGMDLTPAQVGLLITLMGVGGGLAYLPAGLAADYTRSRGLLLLMTFWWVAIGYFIASLAPGYWWLVTLLAIAVMGDAAWHPIATGVLTQKMPDRKARALGIHAMGGTIGAETVAPPGGGVSAAVVRLAYGAADFRVARASHGGVVHPHGPTDWPLTRSPF